MWGRYDKKKERKEKKKSRGYKISNNDIFENNAYDKIIIILISNYALRILSFFFIQFVGELQILGYEFCIFFELIKIKVFWAHFCLRCLSLALHSVVANLVYGTGLWVDICREMLYPYPFNLILLYFNIHESVL